MTRRRFIHVLILTAIAYVFLMLGNGIVSLTNPDEVFYTQTAREMIQRNTWMTPYLFGAPQFEKPILLYWLMRISIGIFGDTSFAARFAPAFFAILGALAVYFLSLIGFKDEKKAFLSSLVLISTGFYIGLARSVFTDMIFSVLILFSLASFYWSYSCPPKKAWGINLFFIFSGLAVLAKGPLGFLIPAAIVAVFLFIKKDLKFIFCKHTLWGLLFFLIVALPWYILMEAKYGASFNREFFYNDHFVRLIKAEHLENDRWYFYPFTMVGPVFPWCLYTFFALVLTFKNIKRAASDFIIFLAIWIVVVLLAFQFAHSKLTSYIFPLFPALAILTADFIYNNITQNKSRIFLVSSLIMSAVVLLFPVGLIAAMPQYSVYLTSKAPVYLLAASLFILGLILLNFALRRKYFGFTLALSSLVLILLFAAAPIHEVIEPYVSSRNASEYLMKNYNPEGPIICSKFYARGVRVSTGKEVAVVDIPGTNFFSPHPVPFLNSHGKVKEFVSKQPAVTYGIFKRANVKDFESFTTGTHKFEVLKQIGNEYVVRFSPL